MRWLPCSIWSRRSTPCPLLPPRLRIGGVQVIVHGLAELGAGLVCLGGLGLIGAERGLAQGKIEVPAEVTELVEKRAAAKKAKDWAAADAIRAQLTEMGWAVKDTAQGPQLSKI